MSGGLASRDPAVRPCDPRRPLALAAPAKVNLLLRVLHRRPDGFHELESLFQAIDLCDRVVVARGGEGVRLLVEGPDLGPVEQNLAHRAARAFLDALGEGSGSGVAIRLEKRIPAGAGLGGGSSDAAAVLRCMNTLWGDPLAAADLSAVGASLGSDVPFFLGGCALAWGRGRGEELVGLPPLPVARMVVVLPPVHVATGGAYGALARHREDHPAQPRPGWDPAALGAGWDAVASAAVNDFEAVVPALHPPVAASLDALRRAGADLTLLSGSGGACFGLFAGAAAAEEAAREVASALGWAALAVRTLERLPDPEPLDPGPPEGGGG